MLSYKDTLVQQIRMSTDEPFEQEVKFWPDRKWRFDIAFLSHMLAVEYDGGVRATRGGFSIGRHPPIILHGQHV